MPEFDIENIIRLLATANKNGINVSFADDELIVRFAKGKEVDRLLLEELKVNKPFLVEYFKTYAVKKWQGAYPELKKADRNADDKIPVSYAQERLWFIDRLEGSTQFHLPVTLRLKGALDIDALSYAIRSIVKRHEVLRTVILEKDGQAYQHINDGGNWKLDITDLSANTVPLDELVQQLIGTPFNLAVDFMLRANLLVLKQEEYLLVVTMHHIASDGWSMSVIVKEVVELYNSFTAKQESNLAPLPVQYADYAIWQRDYLKGTTLETKLSYWRTKLANITPIQLPADFKRPSIQTDAGARVEFEIDKTVGMRLQALSRQQDTTLFMTLLAAFKVLLYRYSGQADICVGTPIANRTVQELDDLIGFFVNTLALRTTVKTGVSFRSFLQEVKTTTMNAYEHQDTPFEKIVDAVAKTRDLSRSPVFQVMFVLQNTPDIPELRLGAVTLSQDKIENTSSKYDLTLTINETPEGLKAALDYSTNLFKPATIQRLISHYNVLLQSILANPDEILTSLPMLTGREWQQLLVNFNDTSFTRKEDQTVISLFEKHVKAHGDNIAILFREEAISYALLNTQANQLAHQLIAQGVVPGALVPLCIDSSPAMMVSILAILKAGAAFVPIDPEYPSERMAYILEDTAASIIVSNQKNHSKIKSVSAVPILLVDDETPDDRRVASANPGIDIPENQLAYIIYTSGSTGTPKGVMIEHGSLINYLINPGTDYINTAGKNTGSYIHLSYTFDASLTAMFMPLIHGKSMVIGSMQSVEVFEDANLLKYAPYDFIKITPSHLELIAPAFKAFKGGNLTSKLVIGGEALYPGHFELFASAGINVEVINEYGPTEATVGCTTYSFFTLSDQPKISNGIPIGKPIGNTAIYILDEQGALVPVGVKGEICIAGAGIARGYLNREALTEEKFTINLFNSKPDDKMYRTGDLGRWLADGNIEYLGRRDDQVKIRGYRIEPGEIEAAILAGNMVTNTAVLAKDDANGNKRLIAYIVTEPGADKEKIKSDLSEKLPAFMIPAIWVEMNAMPLTTNGKVDKAALPDPAMNENTNQQYVAPGNEIEIALVSVWEELLQAQRIGIHDNFFELGGDSILTIQVVSRARRVGIELKPKDLFIYQNIARLAEAIADRTASSIVGEQGILKGESGLLPIQTWFLEQQHPEAFHSNQSVLLGIDKSITQSLLNNAFQQIMLHHDALRFKYNTHNGQWIQEYGDAESIVLTEIIPSSSSAATITEKAEFYQQSLNIQKGELVKIVLMQTPDSFQHNRLLIVVHHLAMDGVSWRILLEDLEQFLNALVNGSTIEPGLKSSSFRQWHQALVEYSRRRELLSQQSYWQQTVLGYTPLPVDKTWDKPVKVKDVSTHTSKLDATATNHLLHDVPRVYHTVINDLLMAALLRTISGWTGLPSVTIGMEGHGREDIDASIDTSRTVGWFTSLYPILLTTPAVNTDANLIRSVKEQLRQLPAKGLGYGVLKYINQEPLLQGIKEPWDIVFNYLGQLDVIVAKSAWLVGVPEDQGAGTSIENLVNEKISINSFIRNGELIVSWSFSNKHFHESTIKNLAENYISNLQQLISHSLDQYANHGSVVTPSDFGLGNAISIEELDNFLLQPYQGKPRKESVSAIYPLSGLQEGMLFHGLYDAGIGAYIEQLDCELFGVDVTVLGDSWAQLLKRHTILRTAFYINEFKIAVQCVYDNVSIPIDVLDYRAMSSDEQQQAIRSYDAADKEKGFDYTIAPLMRLTLFRLGDDHYRMLWTSNHILFDGWSFPILLEEFLTNYELLSTGNVPAVMREDRYEDYIRYIQQNDPGNEEAYWRRYLAGIESKTHLPFIQNSADRNKGFGKYEKSELRLDTSSTARIQRFAQANRVTLNTLMQSVWAFLLHRYTGMQDICYGIVVSGRPDDLPGVEQRVGMYINTLIFHSTLDTERSISEWLHAIQEEQVNARQYQHTPLHVAQAWSGVQGDLFDTLLTFENYPVSKLVDAKKWALDVRNVHIQEQTNYPLSILIGSAEHIDITFSYNTMLLDSGVINEIRGHFENVLFQLLEQGNPKVGDLHVLTTAEENQLLNQFNRPAVANGLFETVISLFEKHVKERSDNIAILFRDEVISYASLNTQANQLAHQLIAQGVVPGALVPLCIDSSPAMMVSILAILKAGAAFVPIDPEYPSERMAYILEDTAAGIIISNQKNHSKIQSVSAVPILMVDDETPHDRRVAWANPGIDIPENQLAYIIYTSGSTGTPKGVMIEHGSLINYLINPGTDYINTTGKNTGSYIHLSYTFDASLTAMFMPLIHGKSMVIGSMQSVEVFEDANLLKYAPYDFIKITPSHLELIAPAFKAFKGGNLTGKLVIGGEALYPGHFELFASAGINVEVINEYGPTEATVGCTTYSFFTLSDQQKISNGIPIGKPIGNTTIYILDEQGALVPVGVKGEICIAGAGIARGYLNREALTEEKFTINLFNSKPDDKMYRTGDLGRWLADGNISYLGRRDDQVKIRGYRIEPGEIEAALQKCEAVSQGVVIVKNKGDVEKQLVSYYVPELTSVRSKESQLQLQRVASWKELYETEYSQTEGDKNIDPEFNIIGWDDSFTGEPMPAADMRKWLDDIVSVVLTGQPKNVLEIGCGTGLIYYQLAGKLDKYIGADLSRSSISQVKEHISKRLRNYGDTELFTAPAHEVTLNKGQQVDTVLLNSMIQYFPAEAYLTRVIDNSISLVGKKGRVIIGDVRDNRLLGLFKARLRLQRLQDAVSVNEFHWGVEKDLLREEELCVSPGYFYALKNSYPQITHVEIIWKQGDYINELTLYRYTVVLYIGISKETYQPEWKAWNPANTRNLLLESNEQFIAIKEVPNPRLWKEKILQQAMTDASFKSVGDINAALENEDVETREINLLLDLAASKGFKPVFLLSDDPLKMNLLLKKVSFDSFIQLPVAATLQPSNEQLTNIPLLTDISFLLQKDIRDSLLNVLPDYMVPAEINLLLQLPITVNGKVNRSFLSQQEDKVLVNLLNYLPPSTELEISIAEIWKNLLSLEKVGLEDNFFEIGGHSLLAMRMISAIRNQLQVELNIRAVFDHPTIHLLSGYVQSLNKEFCLPPIAPTERSGPLPLSFSQERLWFIDQLGGSLQYHIPSVLRITGNLSVEGLSHSLRQIIHRHEVLRSVIKEKDGAGYQLINSADNWELEITDGAAYVADKSGLEQYIKQLVEAPFRLSEDYMLRANLVRLSATDHILVATLHHIASDGWSTSIMVQELRLLYNAFVTSTEPTLPALPVQYADYAQWQRTYLQGEAWDKKLGYWKDKLTGVAALQLPVDYPRPLVQSTRGALLGFRLDKALSTSLQQLSQEHSSTLFMTMLAAFKVLLYRYSGQADICVGTPIAGRQQAELEGLIGFFVNTLALRTTVTGSSSFTSLLEQVRTTTLEAYDHQEVPFEKVVELVVRDRDMSRSPLFQVMLVLQNTPEISRLQLEGLELNMEGQGHAAHTTSKFDLSVNIAEHESGLQLSVEYCTDLYSSATIRQLLAHFNNLLQSIVASPGQSIGSLPMLSEAETTELLYGLNDTGTSFSAPGKTIVELFEEQVKKQPESIALTEGDNQISYRQLNEAANRLAHYLKANGVSTSTPVPVCMVRSTLLVTTLLGILKSGGAYVPIDPEYPDDRIRYMLQDTNAGLLLTDGKRVTDGVTPGETLRIINLAELNLEALAVINLSEVPSPSQLAYIIYTSGSSGRPKGVMIEHKSLANLVYWHNNAYQVTEQSRATAMAGIGFDAFGWEIWPYLSCGASLHIIDDELRLHPENLAAAFNNQGITHSFISTALVPEFMEACRGKSTSLKYLLTGGDKLGNINTSGLSFTLVNNYGPTENTVVTSYYKLSPGSHTNPPIGRAVSNTVVYLLSDDGELVARGVAGELCIGGLSLARGYFNQPVLTAEKFVADKFGRAAGGRIYQSGDLCRWTADGNLEYLGRKDSQVKIRGYRVELGEIESMIEQSGLVKQALVMAVEDSSGNKRLTAYVTSQPGYTKDALEQYLSAYLPVYMVPRLWKELDHFPLTANGKINVQALPSIDLEGSMGNTYVAPRNPTEEKLAAIWQELLGIERVGIHDNFFELGGHSLMAMRMVSAIEKNMSITIPIKALFQFTTIIDFSNYLEFEAAASPQENKRVYKVLDI